MELIKGKWYKNIGLKEELMAKYKETLGSSFISSECFCNGQHFNKEGISSYKEDKITLCTDDDLKKILSSDHPDYPKPSELFIPSKWYVSSF